MEKNQDLCPTRPAAGRKPGGPASQAPLGNTPHKSPSRLDSDDQVGIKQISSRLKVQVDMYVVIVPSLTNPTLEQRQPMFLL